MQKKKVAAVINDAESINSVKKEMIFEIEE